MILMHLDKVGSYVPDDNHEGGKGPGSITTLPKEKYFYTSKTFSLFGAAVMIHLFCYTA